MMLVVLSLYDLFPPPNLQFSGDLRDQETTHHALKLGNFPAVSGGLKRDTVYKTRQFTSKRHSPWKCLTQRKHNGTSAGCRSFRSTLEVWPAFGYFHEAFCKQSADFNTSRDTVCIWRGTLLFGIGVALLSELPDLSSSLSLRVFFLFSKSFWFSF